MKRAVLLVALTLSMLPDMALGASPSQSNGHSAPAGVFDHKSVEEAWKTAFEKKKPLLVMFTSNNCTFCRKMIADTYSNQNVKELLRGRTETVMAHSDNYASLIKKLGIRGYPSSLLISPEGEVLDFMEGYVDPQAFAKRVGPLLERPATQIGMNTSKQTIGQ